VKIENPKLQNEKKTQILCSKNRVRDIHQTSCKLHEIKTQQLALHFVSQKTKTGAKNGTKQKFQ